MTLRPGREFRQLERSHRRRRGIRLPAGYLTREPMPEHATHPVSETPVVASRNIFVGVDDEPTGKQSRTDRRRRT
jgi:hypothetical protein